MTGIDRGLTQIQAFMKRHGLKYMKLGHIPSKADAEKQAQWIEKEFEPELEKAKKGDSCLFFMDAAHFILSAFLCSVWSKVRLFVRSSAGRNRINVLGAVNALTKEVITLQNTYICAMIPNTEEIGLEIDLGSLSGLNSLISLLILLCQVG